MTDLQQTNTPNAAAKPAWYTLLERRKDGWYQEDGKPFDTETNIDLGEGRIVYVDETDTGKVWAADLSVGIGSNREVPVGSALMCMMGVMFRVAEVA